MSDYKGFIGEQVSALAAKMRREETAAQLAAASSRQRLVAVNQEREQQQAAMDKLINDRKRDRVGELPAQLWGEDAAALCQDFLAYVQQHAPNADLYKLRPEVPERRKRDLRKLPSLYPVAYQISSHHEVATSSSMLYKPAYLCTDGLVRGERAEPLPIVNLAGDVDVPEFGTWHQGKWSHSKHWYKDHNWCGVGGYDYEEDFYNFEFIEETPVDALKQVLPDIALRITQSYSR